MATNTPQEATERCYRAMRNWSIHLKAVSEQAAKVADMLDNLQPYGVQPEVIDYEQFVAAAQTAQSYYYLQVESLLNLWTGDPDDDGPVK